MHILIVSECYPTLEAPQYGIFVKQQAQGLAALGNTFDVLIPKNTGRSGELQKHECGEYYTAEYKLFRYDLLPHIAAKSYYDGLLAMLEENKYDAVAVHITSDAVMALTVDACNRLNIPVAVHYHGLNVWEEFTTAHKYRDKWYASRRYRALCRAQTIIGVSEKVSDIVRARLTSVPTYTVYNGVDLDRFTPLPDKEDSELRIIGVGNLIPIKGFGYLISAFARLAVEMKNISLHIIGEGVERDALKALAKEQGIEDKVTFYGKLPYDEVAEEMRRSHLFVLPSFYEALGCVYLEAMACGVPAIGVKGMGIDEIIVDGENGYLAEPRDVDDLSHKMKIALSDRAALAKMSEKAYETAQKYTWEASAKHLDEIYRRMIK